METTTAVRLVRTALVSSVVLASGAGAHVLAGGMLPGLLAMAALTSLTLAVAALVARLPLHVGVVVPAMAGMQLALHRGFEALAMPAPVPVAAERVHHLTDAQVAAQVGALGDAQAASGMHTSAWMLAAHVGATVVAAVVIARGDAAARAALQWLAGLVRAAIAVWSVAAVRSARTVVSCIVSRVRASAGVLSCAAPRGPPVAAPAAA
ncbi:hypothetical protein [Sediminihabitans luteus]|uniref:hypothetical protein n=1 Tax=Sediminihabitans luteus TaxID=1138585 RepID=UPI000C245645|nr:hypothetical protein [Sediminihabitans luteus]